MAVLDTVNIARRSGSARVWLLAGLLLAFLLAGIAYHYYRSSTGSAENASPSDRFPAETSANPWFSDQTAESGIAFTYRNGEEADQYTILESLGGGVALLDYDGDGLLDVFLPGGGYFTGPAKQEIRGHPCRLYRNQGHFKFVDVTQQAGLQRSWPYTHGAAVADYDRDGWPDLLVTGYGRIMLWHNQPDGKGGRMFVEVTEKVGLQDPSWSTSAGWGDLDGDGWPDLYVCHYVDWSFANNPVCPGYVPGVKRDICSPALFKPLRHTLWRNLKGQSFLDVSAAHDFRAKGCGLGVVLADLNDDARPDVYVANDTNNNFLLINRGTGKLEEKAILAGVAADESGRPDGSMGVDVGDYDGSGRASLWVTNFQNETHALYHNRGKEIFSHRSRASGITALGLHFVGFGTGFLDVDNDGWEDLVIANGHAYRAPVGGSPRQRPVLLQNVEFKGRRFFRDRSAQAGAFFQKPAMGRGVAIGDLDNDGWPDLVVSHGNEPVAVLRNEGAKRGAGRWVGVRLRGKDRRDVVGSTVILEGSKRRQTRFVKGGGSYLSAGDSRLLFGLGSHESVLRMTVKWSWGKTETFDGIEEGRYWELQEGEAKAREIKGPAS